MIVGVAFLPCHAEIGHPLGLLYWKHQLCGDSLGNFNFGIFPPDVIALGKKVRQQEQIEKHTNIILTEFYGSFEPLFGGNSVFGRQPRVLVTLAGVPEVCPQDGSQTGVPRTGPRPPCTSQYSERVTRHNTVFPVMVILLLLCGISVILFVCEVR